MCGRFSQSMSLAQLLERFHIDSAEALEWQVKYNVAPSLDVPTVAEMSAGNRKLMLMKWGLVPPWAKDPKYQPIINLRTETVVHKPGFRRMVESARCLVPVDGFNEWKTDGKAKVPYRFVMKSGEVFSLGGLYQPLTLPSGKTVYTLTLITTEANKLVGQVHDRMPVIIPRSHESVWLNPKSKLTDFAACLSPYPSEEMHSYPVSPKINNGKVDAPELIAPLT
jgi:putative SOS response-associated peptidase YedK